MRNGYAFLFLLALLGCTQPQWTRLENAPENGLKQDDLHFVSPDLGWAVNGSGEIWQTRNGGENWSMLIQQPGTYFRTVGFLDSLHGFAGNIGPGFFEGVTDQQALYETTDGGQTWQTVSMSNGLPPTGLCALQVIDQKTIYAGGRVSGPAWMAQSRDGGASWQMRDMTPWCSMIMDLYFTHPDTGFIFAGQGPGPMVDEAKARILYTTDGGESWQQVYESPRIGEICWKASFPTKDVGYVSVLSYLPTKERYFLKTTDGGQSWTEHSFLNNGAVEFGVGFTSENEGWIGTDLGAFHTTDGGKSWRKDEVGIYTNKFRFVKGPQGTTGFAIGRQVHKLPAKR